MVSCHCLVVPWASLWEARVHLGRMGLHKLVHKVMLDVANASCCSFAPQFFWLVYYLTLSIGIGEFPCCSCFVAACTQAGCISRHDWLTGLTAHIHIPAAPADLPIPPCTSCAVLAYFIAALSPNMDVANALLPTCGYPMLLLG